MLSLGFAPCLISFYPSAPLGALLSIDTKVPKKSLCWYAAFVTEIGFAGENPIIVHDAAKVRQFFAHVSAGENPLEFKTFG